MKALVKAAPGPGGMEVAARPVPECGSGEVLFRVTAASICGSDLHMYLGEIECKTGIILGHEFAGKIVSAADDVDRWPPGRQDHGGAACRCLRPLPALHAWHDPDVPRENPAGMGLGQHCAQYMKLPAALLHRIPDSVSDQMAALTEPIAGILGVVNVLGIRASDFVLVIGDGPIGLAAATVARALGAEQVALVGRSEKSSLRLEAAGRMGLEMVLDHDRNDVVGAVKDATGGLGADLVIEAAGGEEAVTTAINAVRPAGGISAIGLGGTPTIDVAWNEMMRKRIQVAFAWSADSGCFEQALSLLADGSISFPDGMIRSYALEQWRDAFEALKNVQAVKAQFVMD